MDDKEGMKFEGASLDVLCERLEQQNTTFVKFALQCEEYRWYHFTTIYFTDITPYDLFYTYVITTSLTNLTATVRRSPSMASDPARPTNVVSKR